MPKTLGRSINIMSISCWTMSPTDATPKGSLMKLYLPYWYAKVVRYEDFLSSFRPWYLELASISVRLDAFASTGNTSLTVRLLCTGKISTWLSLVGVVLTMGEWHHSVLHCHKTCTIQLFLQML